MQLLSAQLGDNSLAGVSACIYSENKLQKNVFVNNKLIRTSTSLRK